MTFLNLTPLNEAFDIPDKKPKKKNKFSNPDVQKELIKSSVNNTLNENDVPQPSNPNTVSFDNFHEQNQLQINRQPLEDSHVTTVQLHIDDPELSKLISPYREDYVSTLCKRLLRQHFMDKTNQDNHVESFSNFPEEDDTTYTISLLIALCLLIEFFSKT